jgi:hypothetical protein
VKQKEYSLDIIQKTSEFNTNFPYSFVELYVGGISAYDVFFCGFFCLIKSLQSSEWPFGLWPIASERAAATSNHKLYVYVYSFPSSPGQMDN